MEDPQPQADDPGQAPQAQPDADQPAAADTPVSDQQQLNPEDTPAENPEAPEAQAPSGVPEPGEDDFDYEAWLEKKGIDPSTPEGKAQIAKSWREMEKKMHQTTQQASEVERQIQGQVPADLEERIERQELLYSASSWKQSKGITPEQDDQMGKYLQENPIKLAMLRKGLITFDEAFALSGAANPTDLEAIKKQGRQEALEDLAIQQRGKAPRGGATTTAAPPKEDPILAVLQAD